MGGGADQACGAIFSAKARHGKTDKTKVVAPGERVGVRLISAMIDAICIALRVRPVGN